MTQHIALLRGLNVGGHRIKMDRLASLFGELGFRDVWTFIASGNVVFSTDTEDQLELRTRIETHLLEALGYEVATFLRSTDDLKSILDWREPTPESEAQLTESHYVVFLNERADPTVTSRLQALSSDMDRFYTTDCEIHWCIQGKLSASPLFGPGISKALGGLTNTMRNRNTLQRLAKKLGIAP